MAQTHVCCNKLLRACSSYRVAALEQQKHSLTRDADASYNQYEADPLFALSCPKSIKQSGDSVDDAIVTTAMMMISPQRHLNH